MVGGKVYEMIAVGDRIWINCVDKQPRRRPQYCAIYVKPTDDAKRIALGDALWWQGRFAFWTPKSREREDVRIPRIGYSGVRRPKVAHA